MRSPSRSVWLMSRCLWAWHRDFLVWPQAPLPRGAEQSPGEAAPEPPLGPPVAPAGRRPPDLAGWGLSPSMDPVCLRGLHPAAGLVPASARNAHSLLLRSWPHPGCEEAVGGGHFPTGRALLVPGEARASQMSLSPWSPTSGCVLCCQQALPQGTSSRDSCLRTRMPPAVPDPGARGKVRRVV